MSLNHDSEQFPAYDAFVDAISVLGLTISPSELHGLMCGYLCAGAVGEGEAYLRALATNKKDDAVRTASLAIFSLYAYSQQQCVNFDFEFKLLLPDDEEYLVNRAQAFSEWCDGFTQAITLVGISEEQLNEEESIEALQHIEEFSQLDCASLDIDEEDERALMEVTEYTRMAILRLYGDILASKSESGSTRVMH